MRSFDNCPHLETLTFVYKLSQVTVVNGQRVRSPKGFVPDPDGLIRQCTACHGLQWSLNGRWYESIQELVMDT